MELAAKNVIVTAVNKTARIERERVMSFVIRCRVSPDWGQH
jgi:hypothetical protein